MIQGTAASAAISAALTLVIMPPLERFLSRAPPAIPLISVIDLADLVELLRQLAAFLLI